MLGPELYNTIVNKLQSANTLSTTKIAHIRKLLRAIMAGKVCAEHSGEM